MKLVARSRKEGQMDYAANGLALRVVLTFAVFLLSLLAFVFSGYMKASRFLMVCILVSEHLRNLTIYLCFMFRAHQRAWFEAVSLSVERFGCLASGF